MIKEQRWSRLYRDVLECEDLVLHDEETQLDYFRFLALQASGDFSTDSPYLMAWRLRCPDHDGIVRICRSIKDLESVGLIVDGQVVDPHGRQVSSATKRAGGKKGGGDAA